LSHYHAEVYIPSNDFVERRVKDALSAYEQRYDHGELVGWWDSYLIGGKWNGEHNIVRAFLHETEIPIKNQDDILAVYASQLEPLSENVMAIKDIPRWLACSILVLPNKIYAWGEYPPEALSAFDKTIKEILLSENITDGYLVTVDCHS
jgi:hypothetical protein